MFSFPLLKDSWYCLYLLLCAALPSGLMDNELRILYEKMCWDLELRIGAVSLPCSLYSKWQGYRVGAQYLPPVLE